MQAKKGKNYLNYSPIKKNKMLHTKHFKLQSTLLKLNLQY